MRLLAVGIVRGVEHLLRRDAADQVEEVDRAPDRGVEEDAGVTGERLGESREVGDPGVGDDQLRLRVPVDEPREVVGDRRQAAPAVDEDGHPTLRREGEDRVEPIVVQKEALGAGMQLDAARAAVEAAHGLLDRLLGEVEPNKGDEETTGTLGRGKRAIVRRSEGRVAVRLVEAEAERAADTGASEERGKLGERARESVDVGPAVHMRIEELDALGHERGQLGVVRADQLLGPIELAMHSGDDSEEPFAG